MITIETAVRIDAPLARVWAVLTDFARYGAWNPYLIRIDGACVAGATITVHSVPAAGAPPMIQPVAVIAVEPPQLMRWEGGLPDRAAFKGDHWWRLTPATGGTDVEHAEVFTGALAGSILARHGPAIRANFERFNAALRARVESGATLDQAAAAQS